MIFHELKPLREHEATQKSRHRRDSILIRFLSKQFYWDSLIAAQKLFSLFEKSVQNIHQNFVLCLQNVLFKNFPLLFSETMFLAL